MSARYEKIRIAVAEENGGLVIQISAAVARDFYRYLKNKGVPCAKPHPAAFNLVTDDDGIESPVASMCQMTVAATMNDFEGWRKELIQSRYLFSVTSTARG